MYDVIIKNGTVLDGSGKERYSGDIAIENGVIEKIGSIGRAEAKRVIDADGLFVAPGFIDVLNHSDTHWRIFTNPTMESLLYQGITTIIGGNCGISLAPLAHHADVVEAFGRWVDSDAINVDWSSMEEFLDKVERQELGVNFGTLVGYGIVRQSILRERNRELSAGETHMACDWLKKAMKQGAFGVSTGLVFSSDKSASREEIGSMVKQVASSNGILSVHLRNESSRVLESLEEVYSAVRGTTAKAHISHLKIMGRKNWGDMDEVLAKIDEYVREGADFTFDVFPYTATGSLLYTLLPDWALDGGAAMMLARLRHFETRMEIMTQLENKKHSYGHMFVSLAHLGHAGSLKNVADIARDQNKKPEEIVIDIVVASEGRAIGVIEALSASNVEKIMRHDRAILSTDGSGQSKDLKDRWQTAHPRSFGAFPKVLGTYVRDREVLTWEQAIRKMTGLPAERFSLRKRGLLAAGHFADVVVFDPKTIRDVSTVEKPYAYSTGVEYLLVNGEFAIDNGKSTASRTGKVLKS